MLMYLRNAAVTIIAVTAIADCSNNTFTHELHKRSYEAFHRPPLSENIELAEALFNGIIGMTAESVMELVGRIKNFVPHVSLGGCQWFGTAPLCMELCPADYDEIREDSGRCKMEVPYKDGNSTEEENCIPDASFGEPCTSFLGFQFKKKFCCKSDPKDCTWSGRWMGAMDSFNIYCRYDSTVGRCGKLSCSVNHRQFQGHNSSLITGKHCDELDMWFKKGKATCGYIAWYDSHGRLTNSWYKTH